MTDAAQAESYRCRECAAVVAYEGGLPEDCLRCGEELFDMSEPPCGDPRPDPRTHPEFWNE